jgi:mevalonate kinase
VHQAKRLTGKATGSQAFIAGIERMIAQEAQIAHQQEEIRNLKERLQVAQGLLRQIAPMCIRVAELAGQKDWLFDTP